MARYLLVQEALARERTAQRRQTREASLYQELPDEFVNSFRVTPELFDTEVWADKKYLTKKVRAQQTRHATGTGGGPSVVPPETEVERRVLEIMGEGFGCPSTQTVIPPFLDGNRCPNPCPSPPIEMEEVTEEVVSDTDHLYCLNPPSPATPRARRKPTTTGLGIGPPSNQTRRVRMRPRRAAVVSKILQVEKQKRHELTAIEAIRGKLSQMSSSMADLVTVLRNLTNSRK